MLVVKIEIWPGGNKEKARTLGTMVIANDGTGTTNRGNYKYRIFGKTRQLKNGLGELRDYPRNSYNSWELVRRILNKHKEN